MPPSVSLLKIAKGLWREAQDCSLQGGRDNIKRSLKCLYAGLEMVLPTAVEVRFRLRLAQLLTIHTKNATDALEHIKKCLLLFKNRGDIPLNLVFVTHSMLFQNEGAPYDRWMSKQVDEVSKLALGAGEMGWYIHFQFFSWRSQGNSTNLSQAIKEMQQHLDFLLFLKILKCKSDKTLSVLQELAPSLHNPSIQNTTLQCICAVECLKEYIETGYAEKAKAIVEFAMPLFDKVDGRLPGFLWVDPIIIRNSWLQLVVQTQLRLGDPLSEHFTQISSPFVNIFSDLFSQEGAMIDSPFASQYQELKSLLVNSKDHPKETITKCQEYLNMCPQFESFRLFIISVACFFDGQPIHHVKTTLLGSLKILNTITQNAMLKIIVLLLVGRLYLDTDFDMSVKMNSAAYNFASQSGWHTWAFIAAESVSTALNLLGNVEKSKSYSMIADKHKSMCNFHMIEKITSFTNTSF